MKNSDGDATNTSEIRGSILILFFRISLSLLLIEVVYAVVYYFLNLQFSVPYEWHHDISLGLFLLLFIKLVAQVYLIILVVLGWANRVYFLTEKHLLVREGVFTLKENIHDFDNIDSISINQSFLGQIFNYGDIVINSNEEDLNLSLVGISDPRKYEKLLKKCIGQNKFTNNGGELV